MTVFSKQTSSLNETILITIEYIFWLIGCAGSIFFFIWIFHLASDRETHRNHFVCIMWNCWRMIGKENTEILSSEASGTYSSLERNIFGACGVPSLMPVVRLTDQGSFLSRYRPPARELFLCVKEGRSWGRHPLMQLRYGMRIAKVAVQYSLSCHSSVQFHESPIRESIRHRWGRILFRSWSTSFVRNITS